MKTSFLVLNGPNLNLLGTRQPEIYGKTTLADIETACRKKATSFGYDIIFKQSNHEGVLVDEIQTARNDNIAGIIINPAAYSHTSIAILDALLACDKPVVEVHLSNIHQRDEFRHHSFVSKVADAVICGCGAFGYELAVDALINIISSHKK